MKYVLKKFTNLIILMLILALSLLTASCSDQGQTEESSAVSEESSVVSVSSEESEEVIILSKEKAVELLERDRLITEIFVCNSLCNDEAKSAVAQFVLPEEDEYSDFSKLQKLLTSSYISESAVEYFLSYPSVSTPSVSKTEDGKTAVFYHAGSSYTDFADVDTVSVEDTETENVKLIKAKTLSGKEIQLAAHFSDNVWKLEKGICQSYPQTSLSSEIKFPLSGQGSFSAFKGNVLVVELYMSDSESSFDTETENNCHEKIVSAMEHAVNESEKFGNDVNVTYKQTYFDHRNVIENNSLAVDFVFEGTSFGSLDDFVEETFDLSEYDNYFIVVCLNKEYDTYKGVRDNTEETEKYSAERIILGNGFTDKDVYTNVLDLLGNPSFEGDYLNALYKYYFPNDADFCEDLSTSKMSDVTAFACGITDSLNTLYNVFLNNQ